MKRPAKTRAARDWKRTPADEITGFSDALDAQFGKDRPR